MTGTGKEAGAADAAAYMHVRDHLFEHLGLADPETLEPLKAGRARVYLRAF
ncbi:hypothetical protein [Streptomyces sp. NPDC050264]|uniref:hypothetical protein n=1 Tax=Streptomyces sp. NPDC050264 TaxID=3155038 RepID=UPI0034229E26